MLNQRKQSLAVISLAFGGLLSQNAMAYTSSQWEPPEQELGRYHINSGPDLDTPCRFNTSGPLVVEFPIPATMNPERLNSEGYLKSAQHLIDEKVIGATATFEMPVYDVDDKVPPVPGYYQPEINWVSFNGYPIRTLSGENNAWVKNSFKIPISEIRFGGNPNIIRIDIDDENDFPAWCMSLDWVAVEFDAAYPYVLAHGIDSDEETWDEGNSFGVLEAMDDRGVLYERFSARENGSVAGNALTLKASIAAFLETIKADQVHIIAHSKGGLDSQYLANESLTEFEVLSLSTLSTPHRGSVSSDVILLQWEAADEYKQGPDPDTGRPSEDPNGYVRAFAELGLARWTTDPNNLPFGLPQGPQPPGIEDLTIANSEQAIKDGDRGNIEHTFTAGADAGPACSSPPSNAQLDPLNPIPLLSAGQTMALGLTGLTVNQLSKYTYNGLRLSYRLNCDFVIVKTVQTENIKVGMTGQGNRIPVYDTIISYYAEQADAPRPNDVVVPLSSAHPGWGTEVSTDTSANHATVKQGDTVREFLDLTIELGQE